MVEQAGRTARPSTTRVSIRAAQADAAETRRAAVRTSPAARFEDIEEVVALDVVAGVTVVNIVTITVFAFCDFTLCIPLFLLY